MYLSTPQRWETESWSKPAGGIGGDFIVHHTGLNEISIVLADAAGHGAAGARVAAFVRPILARDIDRPLCPQLVQRWHRFVYHQFESEHLFVCLTALQLNLKTRRLTIVNGGNPDVLVRRRLHARLERYPSTGMPLGLVDEHEWHPPRLQRVYLGPADRVFCFSDGLIDCLSADGERFGLRRICAVAARAGGPSPLQFIRRGIHRFRSAAAEQDDVSLLVLGARNGRVAC